MSLAKHDRISAEDTPAPAAGRPPLRTALATVITPVAPWLLAVGLALAALNLRPAISALAPLLEEVRADLGMSGTVAGLLTSVPALCFAVFGITAPALSRKYGPVAVVAAGMAAVAAGLGLRSLAGGTGVFLASSALALAGIAVSNILMPVIVKRYFPDRIGSMTGLYTMALSLGAAGAGAITVPVASALGDSWRLGIGVWALPAVLAATVWLTVLIRGRAVPAAPAAAAAGNGTARAATTMTRPDGTPVRLLRSPTAWALACFFGLQATAAYIIMGWLPQIFRDAGVPAGTAGVLFAVAMGLSVPLSFVVPRLATRMRRQGPLLTVLASCGLAGYAGLWLAPHGGAWAWAALLGIANCSFPVALAMLGLRARSAHGVVRLSAFAQSTGYLISLPGPLIVGVLNETTGSWSLPLLFMATLMALQIVAGVLAGRDRHIEDGA
ncbi:MULTISPECIES: CynX/NimT family MFS transporter [unclassified Streptomyces]|uniref:CynX/NimT family MFS transporter n=1 Tax=unclassified Streptomyces TaxID=2593676 RepID=UPI00190463BE|nr:MULTISPECIES: MFS transporter [unclassified Streptomyces]MCU4744849.1 MFS transporter [Streptomyces sp. G-5]QQN80154.1 MFS transporter [Streptomyces sp. XC 2026]